MHFNSFVLSIGLHQPECRDVMACCR